MAIRRAFCRVLGLWSCILAVLAAPALAQSVHFVDADGLPASSYLENTEARVRVSHAAANLSSSAWDTVSVSLGTTIGNDSETLTLTETDRDSGVFLGSIRLRRGSLPLQAGVLDTGISGNTRDTLTAAYGAATDTTAVEALRIRFLHEDGQPAAGYTEGDWVHVRVETRAGSNNPNAADYLYCQVSVAASGDDELFTLQESGYATGVYEGRVRAVLHGTGDQNGLVGGNPGDTITASVLEPDNPSVTRTLQVPLVSSRVEILDEEGRPADSVPEASSIRLRVVDRLAGSPSIGVQVTSLLALDEEVLYLNQTGLNQSGTTTGVYEGRIRTSLGNRVAGNGTLETTEDNGSTHRFDTIELAYGGATDTVQTYGSDTRFADAWGGDVEIYAAGSKAYIRVEAPSRNQNPNRIDHVQVVAESVASDDAETVPLVETGRNTGVFAGSVPLGHPATGSWGDGTLQAPVDEEIQVRHDDVLGMTASADRARIRSTSLQFVEEDGEPTQVLLENGSVRLRALSPGANASPAQVNTITAQLGSRDGLDQETVSLTETGPDTGVFTAEVRLAWVLPGDAMEGNGVLETANGGAPRYLPDLVTAAADGVRITASTKGARVRFLDARGRETGTYAVGETAWVRLEDHNRDTNSSMRQTITVVLYVPGTGEQEMVPLTETGNATGIFEGGILTAGATSQSANNGTLEAGSGSRVRVDHQHLHDPGRAMAEALLIQNAVQFEDAEGQPVETYLRGTEVRVRLFHSEGNASPSTADAAQVLLNVLHTGDVETLSLTETGPDTGVFTGSMPLRYIQYGSGSQGNGFLETGVYSGEGSAEPEAVTVNHEIWNGPAATDEVTLRDSRIWFVDAEGHDAAAYSVGSRVYVRYEDHGTGQPGVADPTSVMIRSAGGADEESVQLQETGPDTGIYEGSIATSNLYSSLYSGVLSAEAGSDLDVYGDNASDRARVVESVVQFVDEQGRPTVELLEGGRARIRSIESPNFASESVLVTVRSRDGGDEEAVELVRASPGSPVFLGEIQLDFLIPGATAAPDGVLQTSNSGPEYEGDEITAAITYRQHVATAWALTVGSRIAFVDAAGQEVSAFALGETARVRVVDHNLDDPTFAWTVGVSLYGPTGEQEDLTLTETGLDTNVYEGSLPTRRPNGPYPGNGWLEASAGDKIDAQYSNENRPTFATARVTVLGGSVAFVDSQGQPVPSYLQGSRAWLRVLDIGANHAPSVADTVTVSLRADLSTDTEDLVLTETGPDTGVFLGSIALQLGSPADDGVLQTGQQTGPPYTFDVIRAAYASGDITATASAGLTGSRTWFVDADGNPVDSYARGTAAYVRVEDQVANRPALRDSVQATLQSLATGDDETLTLLETDTGSGIFQGSLPLAVASASTPADGDGKLHAEAGEQIKATHTDAFVPTQSSALADIGHASVTFIDEAGRSTGQVLEGGLARIRVVDVMAWSTSFDVTVRSSRGADQESVSVTETAPGSRVFEGAVPLEFIPSGSGFSGNGTLETGNSGSPDYTGDTLTVEHYDAEATAVTVPSRLEFIDRFGRVVSSFALGDRVGLRLESHNGDDPATRQTAYVTLFVPQTSESESFQLTETGFGTNVYEGAIPSALAYPSSGNGTLEAESAGRIVEAEHLNPSVPNPTRARATLAAASILFVDAAGQPVESYLESSRAYIRVFDAQAGTAPVGVTVRTDRSQDQELVMLDPVAPGVFVGSIAMRSSAVAPGNGTVETGQLDTLRATYQTLQGAAVTATAGLTGSRTWFVDAYGNPTEYYARGSRAYVRVEDHNLDQPGVYDSAQVTVRSLSTGDVETLSLLETARDGGLFAGSIALEAVDTYPPSPNPGDGKLRSVSGEDIEVVHADWNNATSSSDRARIRYGAVTFIDESGLPTTEVVEGGVARIRAIEPSPFRGSTTDVMVTSRYGADREIVTLTETSPQSGVYEGTVQLELVSPGGGLRDNEVLETSNSGNPAWLGDELKLEYLDAVAHGVTLASRVRFIDVFGRETGSFAVGEPVRVRVESHESPDPSQREITHVTVSVPATGEMESFQLLETGFDTNVYEGSIPSSAVQATGTLHVQPGDVIRAEHYSFTTPNVRFAEAVISGASVLFIDEAGEPAEVYLESTRAIVRVSDAYANQGSSPDAVNVTVRSVLGGDQETVSLTETGGNTGVFEGSIPMSTGPIAQGNGTVETRQDLGTPHEYDSLRVSHLSIEGAVTDTVGTISSRTWFVDAYGNPTENYARGSRAYVRVEDHNRDQPGVYDTTQVTVRSLTTGDVETLSLLETARDGGLFAGSIALEIVNSYPPAPVPGDGKLQSVSGEDIQAEHTDWTSSTTSSDRARIQYGAVTFIDEAGVPTTEVVEGGVARIRAIEPSPFRGSTTDVMVTSRYGADREIVTLTETSPQSGIYEGTVQLEFVSPGGGLRDNEVLETSNSGNPAWLGDELKLEYLDAVYHGVTIASRVQFVDAFGRETGSFAVGEPVRVRVENHESPDPFQREITHVTVSAPATGEMESFQLVETGFDTNVYEGSIPSRPDPGANTLDVQPGDVIRAEHYSFTTPNVLFAEAVISGASVLFIDESGEPAEVYLESTRALVRVSDSYADQGPSPDVVNVTVRSVLGGDQETVSLNETGGNTGVFEGSVALGTGPIVQGNGTVETRQDLGTPHEYDSLRVSHQSIEGTVTDTVGTISSRTWFVDAYGSPTENYARGSRAYVRVEDHNLDQPGVYDTAQVTVRSLTTGDVETLSLLETARDGGLFAGSIALEIVNSYPPAPVPGDGKLQSVSGEDIQAEHADWTSSTTSSDRARIQYGAVTFIDEAGMPTTEVVEGGTARIRAIEPSPFRGSTTDVMVTSRYGADREIVTLTETSPQSGIYEGTVQLILIGPGAGQGDNEVLETSNSGNPAYLGDELKLEYLDAVAHGVTIASRVQFIDAFGRETSNFAVGEPVRVRVENHGFPDPEQRQTTSSEVRVPATGESEWVQLFETGFDTNVYEGSIPSSASPGAGTLQVQPGDRIRAEHYAFISANVPFTEAVISGASVLFVDEAGKPAEVYLESTRAFVRVSDSYANQGPSADSVSVTVRSVLGGDQETVSLTETGGNTGVFEGSIRMSTGAIVQGNGTVETRQDLGTPHEYDSLRVSHLSIEGPVTDTVGTISSRTAFVDAYGSPAAHYARGSRAYVRVEDHNLDQPGVYDTAQVTVRSLSTGDVETLSLLETARDGGLFAGSIALEIVNSYPPAPVPGDGKLQSMSGEDIQAEHTDWTSSTTSSDRARIQYGAVTFIDEAGMPTTEVMEGGVARIRAVEPSPFRGSTTEVMVTSRYGADREIVTLTETSPQSGIYEGTAQLAFVSPGGGLRDNNVLETSNSGNPEYLGDDLKLEYLDAVGYGVTIASRLQFIDAFGQETGSFAVGEPVRVRVENYNFPNPAQRQTTSAEVKVPATGESEWLQLLETGFDTNVYEGWIPTNGGEPAAGTLQVRPGDVIRAEHYSFTTPSVKVAEAVIAGASVLFIDEAGEPAKVYLESSDARLRVMDTFADQGPSADYVSVIVRSELGGDQETVYLTETGGSTGVFEGSIPMGTGPVFQGNQTLETRQDTGNPHEFDSLRASYGTVTDTVETIGSRTAFVDASGNPADTYARGSRAWVRVVDHNASGTTQVTLRSLSTGDVETVTIPETAPNSGVFAGSIALEATNAVSGDGKLQSEAQEDIEAVHTDWTGVTSSSDRARIQHGAVMFVDESGAITAEVVDGGVARIRAIETAPWRGSTVDVMVRSHYGADQETVILTEAPPQSGVYEGAVQLDLVSQGAGASGNGTLETSTSGYPANLGDELTLTYLDATGYGVVVPGRVTFLDIRGEVTDEYALRSPVRVRVESHWFSGTTSVLLTTPNDSETLTLTETGAGTGFFEGTIPSSDIIPGTQGDGILQAIARNVIVAEIVGIQGRAAFTNNVAPMAVDDSAQTEEQPVTIAVLANDSDPESGPLQVSATTQGANGAVVINPDQSVTYTPAAGFVGTDTFTYLASDGQGGEARATVTVNVIASNAPPTPAADSATTPEDQAVNIAVLANDTDPDEDLLEVSAVGAPGQGTAVLETDGTITYTPPANWNGQTTFPYMVEDTEGLTAEATVTVTVTPVNDPPIANDDAATVEEDGSVTVAALATDTDAENDTLTVASVTQGANGAAVINPDKTVTYTPAANFSGTDTFTYTIDDGNGGTDSATVTVTVNAVNDAPVASNDTATVAEDSSVTVTVLTNDTDVENDALDVTAVTQGAHGSVTINPDGTLTYTPAANYHGADSFSYTVSDGNATDTATVTVTVTSANDAPVANDDAATVAEDGSVAVTVLGNDSDTDNDTLNVTAVTQGTNGAVVIKSDRTITYTPATNFHGTDSFTYTVSDGNDTDTATVTVTVTSVNDAPNANDDTTSVVEDGSVSVTVLGNDTDADDDTLAVISVTQGTNGAVVINPDRSVTYTPAANFFGPDAFTYTIADGNGGTDTATVTVTVAPSNDALTAVADITTVAEDASVTVAVLGNDSDPENDVLSVESVTQGTNGAVVINPDKTITYTPNANFHGTDSFTYTASDGNGGTGTAAVTVTVTPVNDEPVAGNDTASVVEDGEVSVSVLGNDADADNDLLDVTAVTQGHSGSVVVNGDNTVTYTPAANFNGTDSFTYTVNDGNGGVDTATVTVTVGAANDAPNANDDSGSTSEDAPVTVSVLGNDGDPENDSLSVASVTQGIHGAVAINANQTVTYTPGANFHGSDSFTYTLSDGNGGTDTATVAVTIASVNDAPVAADDAASVAEDGSVTVTVKANDTDADNDNLDVTSVTQGAHGSVVLNADDTVTYTPAANYNGPASFTYTVIDGNGGTDTATVTVSVGSANDAPSAVNDTATVAEDGTATVTVLANDSDLDNDTLAVTSVTQGTKGAVVRNANNTVTYTPNTNANGSDSFTYTLSDGNGGTATATVAVTITPVNDAPVAVNDSASTLAETPVTVQVRANDTDIDSATLTVTAVTQGAHGSVAINAGQTVTYTPATAWVGPDTFTYTVSDGSGGTATATVSVNVQAPARVSGNIQVLYTFNEGSGTTVNDVSGVGSPLNLTIGNSSAVTWLPGALSIDSSTLVKTASSATKVINAAKASNEVTVEAWVVPANLSQTGPAAIVTISQNATKRNVTLGQSGTAYNGQLRTSATGQAGTQLNANSTASLNLTHVVYTRSSTGAVRIYVNGTQVASSTLTGNLSGWTNYELALGGEASGTRYWLGDLHLVAIYSRSLTATEVRTNFLAGAN